MYIKRELEDTLKKHMGAKEILAVVGPRQCGKTTLIINLLEGYKKDKEINVISFDDVKSLQLFENDIDSFIEVHVKGFDILFIDEVQYSKDSGKKLKYIYDKEKIKMIISGSSAAEISIQSLKYLVGRIFLFTLYPFSFFEYIRAKKPKILPLYKTGDYRLEMIKVFNRLLDQFVIYGGYPRVVLAKTDEERKRILNNIYNTYLLKEIKEIMGLSQDFKLIKLIKSLSLQIGNLINYNELSNITGLSYREVKENLNIMEKTYICSEVRPFSTNKRTELLKNPKIYFFDLGFRNSCIENFTKERTDIGALYENFIWTELTKYDIRTKYWRTKSGAEVDFIIEKNDMITPIEVKTNLTNIKTTKSFLSFLQKYKPKKSIIGSLELEGRKKLEKTDIKFLPLIKITKEILR